jgi:hypothetical protein
MDEGFFVLIFWCLVGPFWIAWKILVLLWQFVVKPLNQSHADRSARKYQQQRAAQLQDKQRARDDARAQQIAALQAAVPQAPPERMRATIHFNEIKVPKMEAQRLPRLLAEDAWVQVEVGERTRYSVDMILQTSERERGIIQEFQLEDIILEDTAAFTERELRRTQLQMYDDVEGTKDILLKEVKKVINKDAVALMKETRNQTRVGDYLVCPFERVFDSPHEAKQYADKLKKQMLPSIKDLLNSYHHQQASETIEF